MTVTRSSSRIQVQPGFVGRAITLGVLLAATRMPAAAAQIPGDELDNFSPARQEFLKVAFADVKKLVADLQEYHYAGDAKQMAKLFTEDGLFAPVEGWYVQGRGQIADTLAARLPRMRGVHLSLIDFTASGGLAYYLGRLSYQITQPAGAIDVVCTFVMVCYMDGRRWKIRSFIERPSA